MKYAVFPEISDSIYEFKALNITGYWTMPHINGWLIKHEHDFRKIKAGWNCPRCPTELELPCLCEKKSFEYAFLELYKRLEGESTRHKREPYFEGVLNHYEEIKEDGQKRAKWLNEHEEQGIEELAEFVCWFGDGDSRSMQIVWRELNDFKIMLDRRDFKYWLKFLELF